MVRQGKKTKGIDEWCKGTTKFFIPLSIKMFNESLFNTQGFAVLLLGLRWRKCCLRAAFNVWYNVLVEYAKREQQTENLLLKGIAYRSERMSTLHKEIQRVKQMDVSRVAAVELLREMISKHEARTECRIRDLERTRDELKFRLSGGGGEEEESKSATTRKIEKQNDPEEEKNEMTPPSRPESEAAIELKKRLQLFDSCAKKKIEMLETEIKTLKAALGVVG